MAVFRKKAWSNGVSPALNSTNLNDNETGIYNAYYQSGALPLENGMNSTLTYTDGD